MPASSALSPRIVDLPARVVNKVQTDRMAHLRIGLKYFLLIPVVPLAGYLALDASGVTAHICQWSPALKAILGEGFGHMGACFSLHYVFKSVSAFWKALTL